MIMEFRFHIKDSQELIHYLVSPGRKEVEMNYIGLKFQRGTTR